MDVVSGLSKNLHNPVMKKNLRPALLVLTLSMICCTTAFSQNTGTYQYQISDQKLYNTILHMDSVYFTAYNNCDMATQAAVYADSIEFYHDKGGLMTSKQDLLASLKKNICGKVTRHLVKGSVEVYPIARFGAVEIGLHQFVNHVESETPSKPDKFIVIWRLRNNKWQITRVVSLH